jgi:hypothetical protein
MSTAKRLKISSFLMFCFAGSTLLVTTPAKALDCMDEIVTIGDLAAAGSCTLKGVLLTYTSSSGFSPNDRLSISAMGPNPAANFEIGIQGIPSPYPNGFLGEFKYNLKAPDLKYIYNYTSAINSATNAGDNKATFDLTGVAGTAMATYVPFFQSNGQTVTNSPYVKNDNYTANVSVTQGSITQFTQSFEFRDLPPAPGPLPLVGLGIALGYSRKLRKRIAAS